MITVSVAPTATLRQLPGANATSADYEACLAVRTRTGRVNLSHDGLLLPLASASDPCPDMPGTRLSLATLSDAAAASPSTIIVSPV